MNNYYRDEQNGIFAGVLAGFANYTGWDLFVLRLLVVIFAICTAVFPFVIAYLVIWMIAPTAPTKGKGKKSTNSKGKKSKAAAAKQPTVTDESYLAPGARAVLAILGVLGFLVFIPALIALVPITVFGIIAITANEIPEKPLFISTVILGIILAVNVIAIGLSISGALLAGRFKKGFGVTLLANLVVAFLIFTATCITAGIWYTKVGSAGVYDTFNNLVDEYDLEINDKGNHLEIRRGNGKRIIIENRES